MELLGCQSGSVPSLSANAIKLNVLCDSSNIVEKNSCVYCNMALKKLVVKVWIFQIFIFENAQKCTYPLSLRFTSIHFVKPEDQWSCKRSPAILA